MDLLHHSDNDEYTKSSEEKMDTNIHRHRNRLILSNHECIICGSKAIGMNFGAPTCAPCKAFFRRNARRKEILESSCHHSDINLLKRKNINCDDKTNRYLQIRRCSSCRLRRCFDVGMKEDLIRTDEENQRHKQLVDNNRKRRELLKQEQSDNQLLIPHNIMNNTDSLNEIDWRHLSNIIYAYDTCCLKTYIDQRAKIFHNKTLEKDLSLEYYATLPINITFSLTSFLKSLPAFQSISRSNQFFLCINNVRRLMLLNVHELNQLCFSEPWQIAFERAAWKFMCGPDLYEQFSYAEKLAEKSLISDPIVTRLWMIVLFFSTPLFSYYDSKSTKVKLKRKTPCIHIQNTYATLLWKYLSHCLGYMEAARIYSNLMYVFLNMLRVATSINIRLRTHQDFLSVHETLDQLATLDINDEKKI